MSERTKSLVRTRLPGIVLGLVLVALVATAGWSVFEASEERRAALATNEARTAIFTLTSIGSPEDLGDDARLAAVNSINEALEDRELLVHAVAPGTGDAVIAELEMILTHLDQVAQGNDPRTAHGGSTPHIEVQQVLSDATERSLAKADRSEAIAMFTAAPALLLSLLLIVANDRLRARKTEDRITSEVHRDAAARFAHLASHDQLTGLANRRRLATDLRNLDDDTVLLMIDLDGFKATNDTFGHEAGDEFLCEVARRFKSCLAPGDRLYRLGGDEFAVLTSCSLNEASALARACIASLEEPISLSSGHERARASVGVAGPTADPAAGSLLRRADIALYDAKSSGGNMVRVLDDELAKKATRNVAIARSLQQADLDQEFRVVFQPIVRVETGELDRLEALARWTSPTHGEVGPDVFIPMAEASGRILEIGAWVLRQSLHQLARWRSNGHAGDIGVSVNVSPRQLEAPGFVSITEQLLGELELDPADLTIELTESSIVTSSPTTIAALQHLRDLGCWVACDDFGSGYSNLGQLMAVPLNMIKIDRSLLLELTEMREMMGGDPELPCEVISAICQIGAVKGAAIVVEGVEEPRQARSLARSGVDLLQGFLFGRPMEIDQVVETFLTGHGARPVLVQA